MARTRGLQPRTRGLQSRSRVYFLPAGPSLPRPTFCHGGRSSTADCPDSSALSAQVSANIQKGTEERKGEKCICIAVFPFFNNADYGNSTPCDSVPTSCARSEPHFSRQSLLATLPPPVDAQVQKCGICLAVHRRREARESSPKPLRHLKITRLHYL